MANQNWGGGLHHRAAPQGTSFATTGEGWVGDHIQEGGGGDEA